MTEVRSELQFLLKHSSIYGVGQMLSRAVAFLLLPLYTRYLTPTDYGILELIDGTSALIGAALAISAATALTRFYYDPATHDRSRLVATAYALAACVGLVALLPAMAGSEWLATVILDDPAYAGYFQVAFAALFLGLFADINLLYMRLLYKSTLYITLSISSLVLGIALNIVFIVWFEYGVFGVLLSTLVTRGVMGVPVAMVILTRTGFRPSASTARAMLAYSAPLVPAELSSVLVRYSDRYLLKHFVSIADAGIYGLARKMSNALHLLITSPFLLTFLPRRLQIAFQPGAPNVLRRMLDGHLLVLLVPATLVAIFIPEIMKLMTTPAYYRAGDLVPVLMLEVFALAVRYHVSFGIIYSKQTKHFLYVNSVVAAVHFGLAFVLVWSIGIWGAAVAALASASLRALLLHLVARKLYYIPFDFPRNAKALAVAAVAVIVARILPQESLLLGLGLKAAVSGLFLLALMYVHAIGPADVVRLGTRLRGASAPGS